MKLGGEVGEEEAALSVRAATASMLAQAGFDGMSSFRQLISSWIKYKSLTCLGANESSMDLLSRMVIERITNLGRTLRLLIDGFSHKMTPDVSSDVSFLSGSTS
jgi:transcriptional activator SPT7